MTQEQLEMAIDMQQEMEEVEMALKQLNGEHGLYGITIQANGMSDAAFIHRIHCMDILGPFLREYFESRKSELEKEFEQL